MFFADDIQLFSHLYLTVSHIFLFSVCVCVFVLAVCQGISNRLSLIGTTDNHYVNMVRTYRNCTVVLENLEITYMEEHRDLSFLRVKDTVGFFGFPRSWLEFRSQKNPELLELVETGQTSGAATHTPVEACMQSAVIKQWHRGYSSVDRALKLFTWKFYFDTVCEVFFISACRDVDQRGCDMNLICSNVFSSHHVYPFWLHPHEPKHLSICSVARCCNGCNTGTASDWVSFILLALIIFGCASNQVFALIFFHSPLKKWAATSSSLSTVCARFPSITCASFVATHSSIRSLLSLCSPMLTKSLA